MLPAAEHKPIYSVKAQRHCLDAPGRIVPSSGMSFSDRFKPGPTLDECRLYGFTHLRVTWVNPKTGMACWAGSFKGVVETWKESGPVLVQATVQATKDIGRNPDVIGKNRTHWDRLHGKLANVVLRRQLKRKD